MAANNLFVIAVLAMMVFAFMTAWVVFFRISCRLCHLPSPSVIRTLGIVSITFVATIFADALLAGALRGTYDALHLPAWELGIAAFFIGLPIDMVLNAGIHKAMMKIPAGKGIEVWFVQRIMILGVVIAITTFVAIVYFVGHRGP